MLPDAPIAELSSDAFGGDEASAVGAGEQASCQGILKLGSAMVLAAEDVLTDPKGMPIYQRTVLAGIDLPVPRDLTNVEAVIKDIG